MSYSVIIVDDEKMVINSLALGFDWASTDFEVIATFQNSKEALEQIKILRPDVVFSDIKMPGFSGLDMMSEICKEYPSVKFVFISGYEDFSYAHKALTLGASGYCLKPLEDEEILEVLESIKLKLIDSQNNLDALFYSMVQNGSVESMNLFINTLSSQYQLSNYFSIAASIQDIAFEFHGYVPFIKIKYEKDTYFYFINDTDFLDSPGLSLRIRHAIHQQVISNFFYVKIHSTENILESIMLLFNHVYSFFFQNQAISYQYALKKNKPLTPSPFFRKLEEAYCKDKPVEIMETLKNFNTLYAEEDRTITEALRIYNLVMASIFRRDDTYFDDPFTRPHQLANSFKNFDEMIAYFIQTIGGQNSSFGRLNMERIKNDTFKQILNYINLNFASPISFQKICQDYAINPSYLSQVFQRELDTTFTCYLADLRINYAKDLLTHTNMLIAEVSEKVGYDQYFYFSKIFKKHTSLSPTQYREQMREDESKL